MLLDNATPLEVFRYNKDHVRYTYNFETMKQIYKELQKEIAASLPVWKKSRFWRPVTFYLFGEGGAGKSNLVQKLFSSELYLKKKKQHSGSNWVNYLYLIFKCKKII